MADEFNPNAIDGDGDGLVQDGTDFERPVDETAVEKTAEVIEETPEVAVEETSASDEDSSFVISGEITSKSTKSKKNFKAALAPVAEGVIGSSSAPEPVDTKVRVTKSSKLDSGSVALFSTRNVRWEGVGTIFRGYNIVSKADSEKWLERPNVRVATPEEIARELKA